MTRRHQLEVTLRALKLSGMLDTLQARVDQARSGDLGHVEFLQVLCEDEIARREAASVHRRIRQARFEQTTTLEDFDFSYNPNIPAAYIRDLAALRFIDAGESIILHGPVGVGKTHIGQALGHQACRAGHTVAFTKTSRLLADLAGGHADRTWGTRLRRWAKPTVLVLDDFAMRDFTAAQADDLYELITERAGRSLIITANRGCHRLVSAVPQPCRRRVRLGPGHQHRPPHPPRRAQLPAQQATQGGQAMTTRPSDPIITLYAVDAQDIAWALGYLERPAGGQWWPSVTMPPNRCSGTVGCVRNVQDHPAEQRSR